MGRKRQSLPIIENVTIESIAAEGMSLFHHDDKVVFVPFGVPGDVVDVQIVKKKHKYNEGRIINMIQKSNRRIEPMCEHFGICGGCKWQMLSYDDQLAAKQQQVHDQLTRIGKIKLPEFNTILGSVKISEYRNKLEFGCCDRRWFTHEELQDPSLDLEHGNHSAIGFHIPGAFDKIYPIHKCWLMDNLHNEIRNEIETYAKSIGMTFYDVRQQRGLLRNLMFRNSNTGEWMLLVQFHYDQQGDNEKAMKLLQYIADRFPQITSLIYTDNQKGNDSLADLDLKTYKGKDFIFEAMEDLKFKVGPKSFYQTNTEQAYQLYKVVREFCFMPIENQEPFTEVPLLYDLYTGTGTIANFVARRAKHVIGIEYVEEAIADAKENSKINNIDNTTFFAGDMKDILTDEFIKEHGRPEIIVTDPPRAGMHPDVVNVILNARPKRLVYVSCNPATQARDLQLLDAGFEVKAVQPVDMFPHTSHVENVVLMTRRSDF